MNTGRRLATKNQVLYANSISRALNLDKTFTTDFSFYQVSKFIRENEQEYKEKSDNRKASIRQIDFANTISEFCGIGEKFDSNSGYFEVSDFISSHKDEYSRLIWRENICEYEREDNDIPFTKECMLFICDNLYKVHGLYSFVREDNVILYIGKSNDLSQRITSSYKERKKSAKISKILFYPMKNMADVNVLEILLIAENNPLLNSESNSQEMPTLFSSGIDIVKDFCELPYFNEDSETGTICYELGEI